MQIISRGDTAALLLALALFTAACADNGRTSDPSEATDDDYRSQPGYIIDSALTMAEQMRRFRQDLGTAPTGLTGGAPSADSLARAFVSAAIAEDSLALQALHITRAEFAYFYFPESELSKPPYEMPPGLLWFQITSGSSTGVAKVAPILRDRLQSVNGLKCGPSQTREQTTLWEHCLVAWTTKSGEPIESELFGGILEMNGVFKIVSFANGY